MKETLITILRDTNTSRPTFRQATEQLCLLIAGDCGGFLDQIPISVKTPLSATMGAKLGSDIVIVPILRAGLAMLTPFLHFYPQASIGFFGMRRDEETKKPNLYYQNLPPIHGSENIIILDPMIATGGSGLLALQLLIEAGATEEKIIYAGIVAAPEGIQAIKSAYPKISISVAEIDTRLNKDAFIVPGIGDFGDRFFGTS